MMMEVPGKRRRWRPKQRWLDNITQIRNDLSERELSGEEAQNRTSRKKHRLHKKVSPCSSLPWYSSPQSFLCPFCVYPSQHYSLLSPHRMPEPFHFILLSWLLVLHSCWFQIWYFFLTPHIHLSIITLDSQWSELGFESFAAILKLGHFCWLHNTTVKSLVCINQYRQVTLINQMKEEANHICFVLSIKLSWTLWFTNTWRETEIKVVLLLRHQETSVRLFISFPMPPWFHFGMWTHNVCLFFVTLDHVPILCPTAFSFWLWLIHFQFHCHLLVVQHSTTFLPISPSCTDSMFDPCFHSYFIFHYWCYFQFFHVLVI